MATLQEDTLIQAQLTKLVDMVLRETDNLFMLFFTLFRLRRDLPYPVSSEALDFSMDGSFSAMEFAAARPQQESS